MKNRDLFSVCLQNLFRRKSRTFLTALGVLVGCCSIVIMVSIGIGMKEAQDKMLKEMGDLTVITVYAPNRGSNGTKLTNKTIKTFRSMPGVEVATPKLSADNISIKVYAGRDRRFVSEYTTVVGLETDAIEKLGYKTLSGTYPKEKAFTALTGQYFAYSFSDTKRPPGQNMVDLYSMYKEDGTIGEPPDPYFNIENTPLTIEVEAGENGKKLTWELTSTGTMKEDYGKGYETSQGVVMRLNDLQEIMDTYNKESNTKVNKNSGYQTALVKVDNIQRVAEVEKSIKAMGFRTSSMESIRQPMEKEARQKQMMFAGLGAISLFVAALGITNTMIMSISERTREIGVMKALGCYVHDIRSIFLLEAGAIGLLGGVAGVVLSVIISATMNLLSTQMPIASAGDVLTVLLTPGSRVSVIPLWLLAFALVFSIFVGVGSGYYPANKAVQISALEAIKHD